MVLKPLEFSDCLTDSPYFRANISSHERELLGNTSKGIKTLIGEMKEVYNANKTLARANMSLAKTLAEFQFETIESQQTDDERNIAHAFRRFADHMKQIEQDRASMLDVINKNCVARLEEFRKKEIGTAKDEKKRFDKQTARYCQQVDKHVNLSLKKHDPQVLHEADHTLELEQVDFTRSTMEYVLQLHGVQEKKKFEFVEILLGFVYHQMLFHHQGYERSLEFKPEYTDLQMKLLKTRENFKVANNEAKDLMEKMLHNPKQFVTEQCKQGYLFLLEKRALGTTWTKHYCMYKKETRKLTLIPFSQVGGKITLQEQLTLKSCTRRASDSIDRRFCFDIEVQERQQTLTLQAVTEDNRREWLLAMDGKEPVYQIPKAPQEEKRTRMDETGVKFVDQCIAAVESRGLRETGPYRLPGVTSKIDRLVSLGLDPKTGPLLDMSADGEFDLKTVTSALKYFFRNLAEPIMTFDAHQRFIAAAKLDNMERRVHEIHTLTHGLPQQNRAILTTLVAHLRKITDEEATTKMSSSNMGVVWGPSLMRPRQETVAAIMDIKFCNVVIEILIDYYDTIFKTSPDEALESVKRLPKTTGGKGSSEGVATLANLDDFDLPPSASADARLDAAGNGEKENDGGGGREEDANPYRLARRALRPTAVYHPSGTERLEASPPSSADSVAARQSSAVVGPSPALSAAASLFQSPSNSGISASKAVKRPGLPSFPAMVQPAYAGLTAIAGVPSGPKPETAAKPWESPQPTKGATNSRLGASSGSLSSVGSTASGSSLPIRPRRARTLYLCEAENETELSFEPHQILTNVVQSREPGWMEGTLNGRRGLVPANYLEYLPD